MLNLFIGACTVGINERKENIVSKLPITDINSSASQSAESFGLNSASLEKKRKKLSAETDETRGLTNSELQRLVLLEQLKLIRMQQNKLLEKERETIVTTDPETFISYRVLE